MQTAAHVDADPRQAALAAGLVYVAATEKGLRRRRAGKGFIYHDGKGERVDEARILRRIHALAIPPAWKGVWICPTPRGHIQAIGFDERGRKQYCYHPRFREVREGVKFDHLLAFAAALPALRGRVEADMRTPGIGHDKVVGAVIHLLETTMIRVGNQAYARENHSYGLASLHSRHVVVEGAEIRFHFTGKSGKTWRLGLRDRRVARIVRTCQDIPGQALFQYLDDEGARQTITAADVNRYLKASTGQDISAKDFRTWAATVLAAAALAALPADDPAARAKALKAAIAEVAARLGNTPTVCRNCYIHPRIMQAYLDGELRLRAPRDPRGLTPDEAAVAAFLRTSPPSTSL